MDINELNERIRSESYFIDEMLQEMHKVVVGQGDMLERLLIGLFANGHILLEGVPGLAKTLAIKTLAPVRWMLNFKGFSSLPICFPQI